MADSPQPSVAEIAAYVAESCAELRRVATAPRLRTVSYLLDMARLESEKIAAEEGKVGQPSRRPPDGGRR